MDDNRFLKIAAGFIALVVAGVVMKLTKPVLFPLLLAIFISYIINPALSFLMRRKIPRPVAIIVLVLVTFSLMYLLGSLFYANGKAFASALPRYSRQIESSIRQIEAWRFFGIHVDVGVFLESFKADRIAAIAVSALGPFFSFISNLLLVLVFLIFILAGRGKLSGKIDRSFSASQAARINGIMDNIDRQIQKYLAIKTVFCVINGLIVGVVLTLFGVEFALVFGFLAFLLNYIPNIGSTIATAVPVVIAFFQFGSIWRSLWILLIVVVLDNVVGNFAEPRFMGKGLGLSP